MEHKTFFAQDLQGNVLANADVTVRLAGTEALASIFAMDGSTMGNPFKTKGNGELAFSAENGEYDIYVVEENSVAAHELKHVSFAETGPSFTDLPALQENLAYQSGQDGKLWRAGCFVLRQAAVDAVDQDVTTSGGAKLYEEGPAFSSRTALVKAVARGWKPRPGHLIFAGGYAYQYAGAATTEALPGLEEWRPWMSWSPYHWGAVGDGVVDDAVALQQWATYISQNACISQVGSGVFKTTKSIKFTGSPGWGIVGTGMARWGDGGGTTFVCHDMTVPLFDFGGVAGAGMHSVRLEGFEGRFNGGDYSIDKAANVFQFSQMAYHWTIKNVKYGSGWYGWKVVPGVGGPWATTVSDCDFANELVGGAMDWTDAVNAVPRNRWTGITVYASNMKDTIFKAVKGYNWTIDNLEILDIRNVKAMSFRAGASLDLGSVKFELMTLDDHVGGLFDVAGVSMRIGSLTLSGTYCTLKSTSHALRNSIFSGNTATDIDIEFMHIAATEAPENYFITEAPNVRIGKLLRGTYPPPYSTVGSNTVCETLRIESDLTGRVQMVTDADASLKVSNGNSVFMDAVNSDLRTINFEIESDDTFNGLYLELRLQNPSAFDTVMTVSNITKLTLAPGQTYGKLVWSRAVAAGAGSSPGHAGWKVMSQY